MAEQYDFEGTPFTRLMGSKPKDTPNYPLEEVMNSNSLGLSDIRSRNLRKAEAAKKTLEAQKKLLPVDSATVVSSAAPANDHAEESDITSVEPAFKKKRYSIKVDNEAEDKANASNEPEVTAGEDFDPEEFARQERLRKQREKQVATEFMLNINIYYLFFIGKVSARSK